MKWKMIFPIAAVASLAACKPTASDQEVLVDYGKPIEIFLKANDRDGDPLTWTVVQPTSGKVTGTPPNVRYEPNEGYYGPDSFTFKVNDGQDDSNIATVTLAVNNYFPNWETDQGNALHDGHVPVNIDVESITGVWTRQVSDRGLYSQVVTGNGHVYVANAQRLMALRLSDGEESWAHQVVRGDIDFNAPAYSNGAVYIQGSQDSGAAASILKYSALSGDRIFRIPFGSQWYSFLAPTVFDDGVYINGGYYGGAYGYGLDGDAQWFTTLPQEDNWTPAVDENRVIAWTGEDLHVLDRLTGEITAHIADPNAGYNGSGIGNAPILDQGRNFVYARQRNRIAGFDLNTNTALWSVTDDFNGKMAFDGQLLYANNGTQLVAINPETGETVWSWESYRDLDRNVVVTNNVVFTSSNTTTYAVSKETHEQVWMGSTGGSISLSGQGGLLIASEEGVVALYDIEGDSDSDGVPDWYERANNSNPWKSNAIVDLDADNLGTLSEYRLGTSPLNFDSDNDGLSDSVELNKYETNPLQWDTDGDGINDRMELANDLNPKIRGDAFQDTDGDGYLNTTELNSGSLHNDPQSIPNNLFVEGIDFENGAMGDQFQIRGDAAGWEVVPSNESSYHLASQGTSTLILKGVFEYGELRFDSMSNCNSVDLYVDGEYSTRIIYASSWRENVVTVDQGPHTIEWIMSNCREGSLGLDNFTFTKKPEIDLSSAAGIGVERSSVKIVANDGSVLESFMVPKGVPGCCGYARDLVALDDGRIAFVNGTFSGALTLFDPVSGFTHIPLYNWHTVNNGTYGGIDTYNDGVNQYVFMSATEIANGPFEGFVRVNVMTHEVDYIEGPESIDVTIGQDGFFYTLGDGIHKYDLETLEYLGEVLDENARAIAVDANSNIYLASWGGTVSKLSPAGELLSESTLTGSFYDINLHDSGYFMVSDRNERISVLDPDLGLLGSWEDTGSFSAWGLNVDIESLSFPVQATSLRVMPMLQSILSTDDGMDEFGFYPNSGAPGANQD